MPGTCFPMRAISTLHSLRLERAKRMGGEKSVSRCIERGKKLLDNDKEPLEYLQ